MTAVWGQVAYEAYIADCGGKSVHGEDLPSWGDAAPEVRRHWERAAEAVVRLMFSSSTAADLGHPGT